MPRLARGRASPRCHFPACNHDAPGRAAGRGRADPPSSVSSDWRHGLSRQPRAYHVRRAAMAEQAPSHHAQPAQQGTCRTRGSAVLASMRSNAPASRASNATNAQYRRGAFPREKIHDASQLSTCQATLSDAGASIIPRSMRLCGNAFSSTARSLSGLRTASFIRGEPRWPVRGSPRCRQAIGADQ